MLHVTMANYTKTTGDNKRDYLRQLYK